jgi:hypothetical protein
MQPYEFGHRVGLALEKRADWEMGGFNPFHQDNQLARTVGYFMPGVGSALAAQDLYHNVSQGNVIGSLGSAGMMALGFIPGAGLLTGGARVAARGGRALMSGGRVAQTVGKGLQAAADGGVAVARGMTAANRTAKGINTAMSQGIQKHIPIAQTQWKGFMPMTPLKSLRNAAVRNPINTVGITMSSTPPQDSAAQIAGQQFGQSMRGPGVWGGGMAGRPLASF